MKDLLVYTADADALATVRSLLRRPADLALRELNFEVLRHPQRDSGMVNTGPELTRRLKREFTRVVLLWDHHGSNWDLKCGPDAAAQRVQERLDSCTWADASAAFVLVPELEEWLWHDPAALCRHWEIEPRQLSAWRAEFARLRGLRGDSAAVQQPKEMFEYVHRDKLQRTVSPRDFERIASQAAVARWSRSASFAALLGRLQTWFGSRSPDREGE